MRLPELVSEVHIRAGCISKREARECVLAVAQAIEAQLAQGGLIRIDDFGHNNRKGFVADGKLREGMKAAGVRLKRRKGRRV